MVSEVIGPVLEMLVKTINYFHKKISKGNAVGANHQEGGKKSDNHRKTPMPR